MNKLQNNPYHWVSNTHRQAVYNNVTTVVVARLLQFALFIISLLTAVLI